MAGIEAHEVAVHRGAGVAEQVAGGVVAADLDADVAEELVGLCLDERQALVGQELVERDLAPDEGGSGRPVAFADGGPPGPASRAALAGERVVVVMRVECPGDRPVP